MTIDPLIPFLFRLWRNVPEKQEIISVGDGLQSSPGTPQGLRAQQCSEAHLTQGFSTFPYGCSGIEQLLSRSLSKAVDPQL